MSAWIVTAAHISALVNAGLEHGLVSKTSSVDSLNAIGQMLWRENHMSVNARYNEETETPVYSFEPTEASLDPSAVEMLADCYAYQSCEHARWEASSAKAYVDTLVAKCSMDPRHHGKFVNTYGPDGVSMWGINALSEVPVVPAWEPSAND